VHDAAQYAPIILSFGARLVGGKCGSIFAHCSSLNQNRLGFMVGLPVG
jgi:methionine synthase I (cobalamin-dependent)